MKFCLVGRGFSADLHLRANRVQGVLDLDFPYDSEQWERWKLGEVIELVSRVPFRIPPGGEKDAIQFNMRFQSDPTSSVDFEISAAPLSGGPGSTTRLLLPEELLKRAYEHYTHSYATGAEKRSGDDLYEREIRAQLQKR